MTQEALTTLRNYRSQNLKDYNIMVEYKMLKEDAPRGVYLLPAQDNLREYFGVIFVEAGLYRGAIFRFRVELSKQYPSNGALPCVYFVSRVFHPYVHPSSGDLNMNAGFPSWHTPEHTLGSMLAFVKQIFYLQDYGVPDPTNFQAAQLWTRNQNSFLQRVEDCVSLSIEKRLKNDTESTIRFTEFNSTHNVIRDEILRRGARRTPMSKGGSGAKLDQALPQQQQQQEGKPQQQEIKEDLGTPEKSFDEKPPSPVPFPRDLVHERSESIDDGDSDGAEPDHV